MNKSPMELKCDEMAEKHLKMLVPQDSPTNMRAREFKAGFKAALDLPEVKALVDALEDADKELRWHAEKWSEEGFGDVKSGRSGHAYQGAENISQALKSWKSFKGE